jgi:branched-chain amino acid transport system permease protein
MIEFIQHLVNGASLGGIYALVALGYTMVFGVLQLINFAHGDLTALGALIGLFTYRALRTWGVLSPLTCFFFMMISAMTACAFMGFCIEKLAYKPLRKAPRINILITTVGVSLLIEYTGQLIVGTQPLFFPPLFSHSDSPFLQNGNIAFNPVQFIVLGVALSLAVGLRWLIFRTRFGLSMRAVSFHHENASLMGISPDRVISLTFMMGSALAGAAGILIGLMYPRVDPFMGTIPGLKAFTAAVLGGIGNISGAVVGAFFLGLAEELIVGYGNPSYRDAFAFLVLILVLLIRPAGLFGKPVKEKV